MRLPTEFLTPTDFEAFARRIVSIILGKEIIGFGEGKDDGIDGLDDINSPTIVVQAKRYQSRTPLNSFKKIVKREIDKIRNTAKKYEWNNNYEYVIVTSMDLNPLARKEIRDYAGSLIPSDKNIIDGVLLQDLADKQKFHETFVLYNLKEKN
ncbi:restriction endonuclease [Oceanobacillus jeddahense]|uniref:restriction endonuclease n=1 Tax=Oceanobacillus jeddahense TaxID=1462527 RepID=UPI0005960BF8|nr:restriction endonuclease [Oceanobacillus jeddahense]